MKDVVYFQFFDFINDYFFIYVPWGINNRQLHIAEQKVRENLQDQIKKSQF